PVFDGSELSVTFVRTAVGPNTRAGLELIRIQEIATDRGLAMVRTRARFQPIGRDGVETQATLSDPVALVRAPYRIMFSYAGADRAWRPRWGGETQLPRAIRVQLREAASDRPLSVSTATLVHAEMPSDCVVSEVVGDCLARRGGQPQPPTQPAPPAQPA